MNLVIDVGNTRTKLAVYQNNKLQEVVVADKNDVLKKTKKIFEKNRIQYSIMSKVSDVSEEVLNYIEQKTKFVPFTHNTNLPFQNLYATPKTLGLDRLALAAAALHTFPKKNVLVIDAGTCITYDFLSKNGSYLGGAIAPGLKMRYKALHNYTAKLPFLEAKIPLDLIGNSTENSIHSGVVNGVIQEIEGVILQYKNKYSNLTVVLTGGDTKFLSKQLKSSIFANQNFLLDGLNKILIFNNNK